MVANLDLRNIVNMAMMRPSTNDSMILDAVWGATQSVVPSSPQHVTLNLRCGSQRLSGQFYLVPETHTARMLMIAPRLDPDQDDQAWLAMIDLMTRHAGQQHAHALSAEVEEDHPLCDTLRHAGFAIYSRQRLWVRSTPDVNLAPVHPQWRVATESDHWDILRLYGLVIPRMLEAIVAPHTLDGWVLREGEQLLAYMAISAGDKGVYVRPFIHADAQPRTRAILADALYWAQTTYHGTITLNIPRYMLWLERDADSLGFEPLPQQALLVKHLTVRPAPLAPHKLLTRTAQHWARASSHPSPVLNIGESCHTPLR